MCQSVGHPSSSLIKKSRQGLYQVHSVKAYVMLFHTVTPLTLHVANWSLIYSLTRYAPRNFNTWFRNATYWRNCEVNNFNTLLRIYIIDNKYNLSETTSFVCEDINQASTISTTTFSIWSKSDYPNMSILVGSCPGIRRKDLTSKQKTLWGRPHW